MLEVDAMLRCNVRVKAVRRGVNLEAMVASSISWRQSCDVEAKLGLRFRYSGCIVAVLNARG